MNMPATSHPTDSFPFPTRDTFTDRDKRLFVATTEPVGDAAISAREGPADASRAQDRAESVQERAAGYIRCHPWQAVMVAAALGVLAGLLAARLQP